MSLDTVTRINDFFEDNVATPNDIYTIYKDKNYASRQSNGAGPFCEVWVESSFDSFTGYGAGATTAYNEAGVVVIRIFVDEGLGDRDLYSLSRVYDLVRDSFRDQTTGKQLKLWPTGSEEGMILFENLESRQTVTDETTYLRPHRRKDIFINYQKLYSKS